MIEKNYWDQQVLNAMWQALEEGQLTINHEVDALFDSLESAFPVAGSKIDWNEVPGSVYLFSQGAKQADFEHFYHDCKMKRFSLLARRRCEFFMF